jgi:tryptophan synthase alpha chain
MSRIASAFAKPNHIALIPYITVGYPSIEATLEIVPLLARSGCDIVELGIPFSDPLADGATIQQASYQALRQGVTPELCLEVAQVLSQRVATPLVFMTYYNPVLKFGLEEFCSKCAEAAVDGLIVPDLPPEEGEDLEVSSRRHELDLIYLLTPGSTEERIDMVASRSSGFIYLVSLTGVTGTRDVLPDGLETFVNRVRTRTGKPLCVGFGVTTPEQVRRIAKVADGVIVGSRIIQLMEEDTTFSSLKAFTSSLREALG